MAKPKFDIRSLMNEASTGQAQEVARKTVTIPLELLDPSPENLYSMGGLDELAASIEMVGLLQPLLVRRKPDGRYAIIAGHRRRAALQMLVDGGSEEHKSVSCVLVTHDNDVMAELQLLMANSTTRIMTDADKVFQAERIKELLMRLKESGYKFGMRMRDVLAQLMNVSYTNAGRYESIIKNLSEEWRKLFSAEKISVTTAYEISRRAADVQVVMLEHFRHTGVVRFPAQPVQREAADERPARAGEPETPRGKPVEQIIEEAKAIYEENKRHAAEKPEQEEKSEIEKSIERGQLIANGMKNGIQSAARVEEEAAGGPVEIRIVPATFDQLKDGTEVCFINFQTGKTIKARLEVEQPRGL